MFLQDNKGAENNRVDTHKHTERGLKRRNSLKQVIEPHDLHIKFFQFIFVLFYFNFNDSNSCPMNTFPEIEFFLVDVKQLSLFFVFETHFCVRGNALGRCRCHVPLVLFGRMLFTKSLVVSTKSGTDIVNTPQSA